VPIRSSYAQTIGQDRLPGRGQSKLVAASECDDEEKRLAIHWVSELTDELMAKIRAHEYNRSMDLPG
jgi:hypothetical protein